ncbi:hypothetical protein [Flaviaesturariibacter flavus]|nr:hypothetical protein [Flaviaesturariibacter flavus]
MKKGWILGLSVLLAACNDSNSPNVETDNTIGVRDAPLPTKPSNH